MIPENTDLNKYRCPLCGGPVKWFWNIPGNGVLCQDKCEKEEDPLGGCTLYNDLGELEKVEDV